MRRDRGLRACADRWGRALLFLLAILICRTEPTAFAQGTAKVNPPIEIPMELLFSRPLLRGTVNGEGPVAVLIDPQLRTTVIAPSLANRLNLREERDPSGIARSFIEFGFGALKLHKVPVEVRSTEGFVPELGSATQPTVIVSPSIWGDQLVTLDYGRFQLRVESGALPEPDGRDVYALVQGSNELRVSLAIGGRAIDARIDLLFPGGVLLPEAYLTELPLASKPADAASVRTREGSIKVREARLSESITVAGAKVNSRQVVFGRVDLATVGYGALPQLSVTYDVTRGRARVNRKQ